MKVIEVFLISCRYCFLIRVYILEDYEIYSELKINNLETWQNIFENLSFHLSNLLFFIYFDNYILITKIFIFIFI